MWNRARQTVCHLKLGLAVSAQIIYKDVQFLVPYTFLKLLFIIFLSILPLSKKASNFSIEDCQRKLQYTSILGIRSFL